MRYKQLTFYHLFTLALIQGITEFLPVSSSGHLILLPRLTNFSDQGLLIDVSVHIGTLIAVVVYFWKDSLSLLKGFYDLTFGNKTSKSAKLVKFLTVATITSLHFDFFIAYFKMLCCLLFVVCWLFHRNVVLSINQHIFWLFFFCSFTALAAELGFAFFFCGGGSGRARSIKQQFAKRAHEH